MSAFAVVGSLAGAAMRQGSGDEEEHLAEREGFEPSIELFNPITV